MARWTLPGCLGIAAFLIQHHACPEWRSAAEEECRHDDDHELSAAADLTVSSLFGPLLLAALAFEGFRQLPLVGARPLRSAGIAGVVILIRVLVLEVLRGRSAAGDEHLTCFDKVVLMQKLAGTS